MIENYKIETIEELNQFINNSGTFSEEVFMNFPIFSYDLNRGLTKKINKYKDACGCETGSIFMVVSVLISAIYILKFHSISEGHMVIELVYCVGFIFFSSILGKLIGISIAKIKMKRLLKSIEKKLLYNKYTC